MCTLCACTTLESMCVHNKKFIEQQNLLLHAPGMLFVLSYVLCIVVTCMVMYEY